MSESMRERVCVVTGANSGMGRVIAEELARRGATVALVCRNRERGEAARAAIAEATGNPDVELVVADLASQESVRAAAAAITAAHERIHVLVNNAGVSLARRSETDDGVERTFATNYLGHFLLTELLLDALKAGAPSRIVNIGSRTGRYRIDFDDLALRRKYSPFSATSQSKLSAVIASVELAERLRGTGVTVNAVHPGLVRTGLTRELPAVVRGVLRVLSTTPEKGARTAVHVATAPELEGVSGAFFGPGPKRLKLPEQARDEAARNRLREESERLARLGGAAA